MKRTTLLITLLLIITLPLAAQNFRIGATAGVNLNAPRYVESKMGFSVGAKGELGFKGLSEGLVHGRGSIIRITRMEMHVLGSRISHL